MLFTEKEIYTEELKEVKEESKSGLYKDLEIFVEDFFDKKPCEYFCATAKDIKEHWFKNDSKVSMSYIRKVLIDEVGMTISDKSTRYTPFEDYDRYPMKLNGRFFTFYNNGFVPEQIEQNPF